MLLVIDANVVVAALISPDGITNDLLFSPRVEGIAPEFIEEEVHKYLSLIATKSGISKEDILITLELIFSHIRLFSSIEYESERGKAKIISPDPNDAEYFALALSLSCPLWSNDKKLKSQSAVKVLSTSELIQFLS